MLRKPIIVGNWKMNGSSEMLNSFMDELVPMLNERVESGLAVPYTLLWPLGERAEAIDFRVGAQNMHYEEKGAYTGELSASMIIEAKADTVIIGHSERRTYYNETDESVNAKLKSALKNKILPIVCCGESLEQREAGEAKSVTEKQVKAALMEIPKEDAIKIVIAYEPIWAIGTGKTASSQDAEDMASHIRGIVKDLYDDKTADSIRIQYGGSVKPANVKDIMSMPNIDGALVGGASLKAEDFIKLLRFYE